MDRRRTSGLVRTGGYPIDTGESDPLPPGHQPGGTAGPLGPGPNAPTHRNGGREPDPQQRRERRLFISVLIVAFLVLASALALAFTLGMGQSDQIALPTGGATARSSHGPATTGLRAQSPGRRVTRRSTTSRPASDRGGSAPVISSLSPLSGGPGQTVTVSGVRLMSEDGHIVAHFGNEVAATQCPAETSCTVVVPDLAGQPRPVRVTVTTETGTSDSLPFHYH